MIDGVKFVAKDVDLEEILNSDLLDFDTIIRNKNRIATYMGLQFTIYSMKCLVVKGSIHKFSNRGGHNYDDFHFIQLTVALDKLAELFKFNLKKCEIMNIEIAANIVPPVMTKEITKGLLMYRNSPFEKYSLKNSDIRQVETSRFILKAYDKALQLKLDYQLFRFEIKYIKMFDLKKHIRTLDDLKIIENVKWLANELISKWSNILYFDSTIDRRMLSQYERDIRYHQWQNVSFWKGLIKQRKQEHKMLFFGVIDKCSMNVHALIKRCMESRIKELICSLPFNEEIEECNSLLIT